MLRVRIARELKKRILVGIPELDPASHGVRLLTEGIYSRVRHPRYAQAMVAAIASAMFTNYLASYVAALVMVTGMFGLVPLEERELRDRFGAEYEAYRARVPHFTPHLWHKRCAKAATRVRIYCACLGGNLDVGLFDHAGSHARLAFAGTVALITRGWHPVEELDDGSVEKCPEPAAMATCTLSIPSRGIGRGFDGIAIGTLAHGAPRFLGLRWANAMLSLGVCRCR